MAVYATIIGFIGVAMLLLAFFLNLVGWVRADRMLYLGLNLVGAVLACWSSYLIEFMPFVLLEGTWAIVAAVALGRRIATRIHCRGDRKVARRAV
jgi:hypothetical protein